MAEQLVSLVVSHSGSAADLAALLAQLKQSIPSITGRTHQALQQQILAQLDAESHSLGVLFVL